jgi:predicted  nucleic acid-binding Zn-ribbon protein
MSDSPSADTPVAIDRVDCTRTGADGVELRLTGRWTADGEASGAEPLLVIQLQGRRHRFAPDRDGYTPPPGSWAATFQLPSWAQPRQEGQAALWVGTSVVPIPLPGTVLDRVPLTVPPPALGEARAWPADIAPPPADADPARLADSPDAAVESGRTGPLAELLFRESVSALHAELEQRSSEVARLQGLLADAQSELGARSSRQSALESAHGDLRGELQELMSAVTAQRDDYERRLAEAEERASGAEVERDRLRAELQDATTGLEAERERLREELQETQSGLEAHRREAEGELQAVRDRTKTELEADHAHAAAQLAELTAARDAAAYEAADLRRRLASAASGRQHHAAELSALRDQLAAARVSREAAAGEVAGLRAELERLGSELAITREHQSAQGADLGEAQRLLAEARTLSEQLRSQSSH